MKCQIDYKTAIRKFYRSAASRLSVGLATIIFSSSIFATPDVTRQTLLVTPPGFTFTSGTFINVGAIINPFTRPPVTDDGFLQRYYQFANSPSFIHSILPVDQLIAAENGLLALIGTTQSDGMIHCSVDYVALSSGSAFAITFSGNQLISFAVDDTAFRNAGKVLVSAKRAARVLDRVINTNNIKQIKLVYKSNDRVILSSESTIRSVKAPATPIILTAAIQPTPKNQPTPKKLAAPAPVTHKGTSFITIAMLDTRHNEPHKDQKPAPPAPTVSDASNLHDLVAKNSHVVVAAPNHHAPRQHLQTDIRTISTTRADVDVTVETNLAVQSSPANPKPDAHYNLNNARMMIAETTEDFIHTITAYGANRSPIPDPVTINSNAVINIDTGDVVVASNVNSTQAEELTTSGNIVISGIISEGVQTTQRDTVQSAGQTRYAAY